MKTSLSFTHSQRIIVPRLRRISFLQATFPLLNGIFFPAQGGVLLVCIVSCFVDLLRRLACFRK